jgi:hypothetical protein
MTGSRPILTLPLRTSPIAPPPRPSEVALPPRPTLTAQPLKVTLVLEADELAAIPVEDGRPRVRLRIRLPDRKLSVDIAAKSLRKAQAAIRKAGADAIALVLQGCLVAGDIIAEAGLSAQPKAKHSNDADKGDCALGERCER